jgi:hypothetical protein
MMTTDGFRFIGVGGVRALICLSLLGVLAHAAQESQFSQANRLLFLTDHLDNLRAPSVLHYTFEKSGTLEDTYKDTIDVKVSPRGKSAKTVELNFFTGARHRYLPPLSDPSGNPIISAFLQREVVEMEERTEGSWRYFQKVIKLALENDAQAEPVEFDYDGRPVSGTEIKIQPYIDDPHRAEIAPYDTKYYVFTLSNAVPGQVYRLRSVVPARSPQAAGEGSKPLVEEVFQLTAVESGNSVGAKN